MSPRGFGAILGSIISGRILLANPKMMDGLDWRRVRDPGFVNVYVWQSHHRDRSAKHHLADHYQRFFGYLYLRANDHLFDGDDLA